MAQYLQSDELKGAVERLQSSDAWPRLVDYLVLKRAMALSGGDTVALSQQDEKFMQAVNVTPATS